MNSSNLSCWNESYARLQLKTIFNSTDFAISNFFIIFHFFSIDNDLWWPTNLLLIEIGNERWTLKVLMNSRSLEKQDKFQIWIKFVLYLRSKVSFEMTIHKTLSRFHSVYGRTVIGPTGRATCECLCNLIGEKPTLAFDRTQQMDDQVHQRNNSRSTNATASLLTAPAPANCDVFIRASVK